MTSPGSPPRATAYRADPPRWEVGDPPCPDLVSRLVRELKLPEPLCRLLAVRGLGEAERAKRHLRPRLEHLHAASELAGAAEAVARLRRAVEAGETVFVHGDYDVDGVCAAALYTRVLRRLGADVVPFVPHRLRDGYDFGRAGVERAVAAGASLVLTADCGIVAHDWLGRARERGLDVVVTDHHTPGATLPPAVAVVNPARADCGYPEAALCGTGVAFKVCLLLAGELGLPEEELWPHLDLVALATVADLVPLGGENRVLVRYGLRALRTTSKPGLRALLAVAGLEGKEVEAGQVGFIVAPRINAAGRVGDADDALRLLLTGDRAEAEALAERLDALNRERQETDRRILDEALDQVAERFDPERDFGVVLSAEGWHPGVIGIVASRVVERIHRPVVMVAVEGEGARGSARSIPGFHLYDALAACADRMERFGGHAQAAGMDLRADGVEAFREAFNAEARRRLEGVELRPRLRVDLEVDPSTLDLQACEWLRHFGPHGIGNPRPVFAARGLRVAGHPRVVGRGHLKLRLAGAGGTLDAIGFDMAERHPPESLAGAPGVDAVFQLRVHEYRGRRSVQARLLDLRAPGG